MTNDLTIKGMTERKYYCLNSEYKMDCIVANLHSSTDVCLLDGDMEWLINDLN